MMPKTLLIKQSVTKPSQDSPFKSPNNTKQLPYYKKLLLITPKFQLKPKLILNLPIKITMKQLPLLKPVPKKELLNTPNGLMKITKTKLPLPPSKKELNLFNT
jgi:hypothetical protein